MLNQCRISAVYLLLLLSTLYLFAARLISKDLAGAEVREKGLYQSTTSKTWAKLEDLLFVMEKLNSIKMISGQGSIW